MVAAYAYTYAMHGIICDRCGTFEPDDGIPASVNPSITIGYWWEADDGTINDATNRYDLCNDCRQTLVDWVEIDD